MTDIEQFLMSLRTHKDADGKLNPIYLADTIQKEIEIIQEAIKHSQRWVGLTDEERINLWREFTGWGDPSFDDNNLMKAIEAKLKEKNT
jgi:hypothetical protein